MDAEDSQVNQLLCDGSQTVSQDGPPEFDELLDETQRSISLHESSQRTSGRPRAPRTDWTDAMDRCLLEMLLSSKKDGLDTDNNNFKRLAWTRVIAAVNEVSNQSISRDICDNRWQSHKRT